MALSKLILVLSLLCSFVFASKGQDKDLIQKICSSARNPNECFELFKGDSGKTARLLSIKAISEAGTIAINTRTILTIYEKGSKDPKLKEKYGGCWEDYIWIMRNLDRAAQSIYDFNSMYSFTMFAISEINGCVRRFGGAPVTPLILNTKIEDMRNICSIILIISSIKEIN